MLKSVAVIVMLFLMAGPMILSALQGSKFGFSLLLVQVAAVLVLNIIYYFSMLFFLPKETIKELREFE
jgi:hypothetical protein